MTLPWRARVTLGAVLSSKTSSLYYSNRWVLDGKVWATKPQPIEGKGVQIG